MKSLLVVALLPPLALMYYVHSLDKREKEPPKLLLKLFIFGCLSVIPTVYLEQFAGETIYNVSTSYIMFQVLENFIGVALIEEGCKYVFLRLGSWKHPAFDHKFDGIVYAVFVSLGFAAIENIMYVFSYGFGNGVMRAVTSIPGHCIFGIFMGYYYSLSKDATVDGRQDAVSPNALKALIVPMLIHGLYDFILSFEGSWTLIAFFAYVIALDIFAFRFIHRASREDEAFANVNWGRMFRRY